MVVQSLDHGRAIFTRWVKKGIKWVAKDTETQSKPQWPDKQSTLIRGRMDIRVFSMCHRGEAYCFPTNHVASEYPTIGEWMDLCNTELYRKLPDITVVYHNANYDVEILEDAGMQRVRNLWDTVIGCWLTNQNEDRSLKVRAPYFGRYIQDTRSVNFDDLGQLSAYAEADVLATDELYQMHRYGKFVRESRIAHVLPSGKLHYIGLQGLPEGEQCVEQEKLSDFHRLFIQHQEINVLKATMLAERHGIPISRKKLKAVIKRCEEDMEKHKRTVFKLAGRKFELGSVKQKTQVLLEHNIPLTRTTAKGAISTKYDFLVPLAPKYPLVKAMIEYAKVVKLHQVYLGPKGLKYFVRPDTGNIHPTLNTVGAVTGRFSAQSPNLQTIPSRNDRYGIKAVFEAKEDEQFICLDFSQIELRVMATLSQDPRMCATLNDPKGDIHSATASNLDVPRDPVAKQCNFLLIFGGGAYALRERLLVEGHDMELDQAERICLGFDETYSRVREFREEMFAFHRQKGYIPLLTGRQRVIENIESHNKYLRHKAETQLANNVVQGCLTTESELMLDNGANVSIVEAMTKHKQGKLHSKIWTGTSWEKITDVFSVGKKPLWEVMFDDGTKFRTSDTHLWKNELGEWVKTCELGSGDYVQQGMRPSPVFSEKGDCARFELAGMLVGDGTYSGKDITLVCKKEEQIVAREEEILRLIVGKNGFTRQHIGTFKQRFYLRNPVGRDLMQLDPAAGREKKVPKWVYAGNASERAAFVRGYFLTDGGTSGTAAVWTSCAKKLIYGLQKILHSLGIASRICRYAQKDRQYYRLKVVGMDKTKLYEIVKEVDCAKVRKLKRLSALSKTNKGDSLPPRLAERVGAEWEATFPRFGGKAKTGSKNVSAMLGKFRRGSGSAEYALELPVRSSTKELLRMRYLRVAKVRDLNRKEEMYDLTVEPSHQYCLWNGAVCHNSAQDLLKSAIIRCDWRRPNLDKLLPSKVSMGKKHMSYLAYYAKKIEEYRKLFKASNLKWRLQVHDEVLFTAATKMAVECAHAIADVMSWRPVWEPVYSFSVAIRADGGVGQNWLAAKKPKDEKLKIESPFKIWN